MRVQVQINCVGGTLPHNLNNLLSNSQHSHNHGTLPTFAYDIMLCWSDFMRLVQASAVAWGAVYTTIAWYGIPLLSKRWLIVLVNVLVTEKVWESDSATDVSEEESVTVETVPHSQSPLSSCKPEHVTSTGSPVSIKKEKKKQSSLFMFVKK